MTTVLDWRKHHLGVRAARCRYGRACLTADAHGRGGIAWMRDEDGKPAHKACAERHIDRSSYRRAA
ncbi:MAG TPA: hypothetical protein VFM54_05260 [Micromonosporaceae bacterium]|nr:hypothetical protein [Micromonosporaceae bacterium]